MYLKDHVELEVYLNSSTKENHKFQENQNLQKYDPPTLPTNKNPCSNMDEQNARFEVEKLHLRHILNQTRNSFDELMITTPDKGMHRLALVETMHATGLHKSMEGCTIIANEIKFVESMHGHAVSTFLLAMKQAVKLYNLN